MSKKEIVYCIECGSGEFLPWELTNGLCPSCSGEDPKKEWDDPNPMEKKPEEFKEE